MRFRFKPTVLSPDHVLYPYWGDQAYCRPAIDILLRGPAGVVASSAIIDSGSPYILFDEMVVGELGLSPPFRRRVGAATAGGHDLPLTFPEDGQVRLLLTDFATDWCLWAPLIGFIESPGRGGRRTGILGITGFMQHFAVTFPETQPPEIHVVPRAGFPGVRGTGRPPGDVWTRLPPVA
jgi:hypothetical protein